MWADIEGWYRGGDAAGGPWRRSGPVGGGPWAWGAGFERWQDEVRRASAAARSAMKVVAAPCWALLPLGLGWLGPNVVEVVHRRVNRARDFIVMNNQ